MLRKPLVVYDGACGICGGNLKWLYRLDWFRRFDALPYQSDEVYKACPQLTREICEQALQLVLKNGRVYSGADAFREVFLRIPRATRLSPPLLSFPQVARDLLRAALAAAAHDGHEHILACLSHSRLECSWHSRPCPPSFGSCIRSWPRTGTVWAGTAPCASCDSIFKLVASR